MEQIKHKYTYENISLKANTSEQTNASNTVIAQGKYLFRLIKFQFCINRNCMNYARNKIAVGSRHPFMFRFYRNWRVNDLVKRFFIPAKEQKLVLILHSSIYPTVNGQSHRTIPTTWPYTILLCAQFM